jgi:hypothetical protein
MNNQVDISALWAIYRCDYVFERAERDLLWDALSKEVFMGTTEKSLVQLIEAYIFKQEIERHP